MTAPRYPKGCAAESQVRRDADAGNPAAAWYVNSNNGNSNNNNRNNRGFALAVARVGEFQGAVPFHDLERAYRKARRQKKPSHNQLYFDLNWIDYLFQLQRELESGEWSPRPCTSFIATRPKAREIHAPDFGDRVVHHLVIPKLEAIYEPRFIHDSYANRKGKGSHAAVRRLQAFVRQVASGQGGGYYLKLDIANFFNRINRRLLWQMMKPVLQRAVLPGPYLRAVHALLRTPPLYAGVRRRASAEELALVPLHKRLANAPADCGIPIGNLSSQFLSNVYLDALDQFVKHELKAKRYLRYVDDFVIVHHDPAVLADYQARIEQFLAERLHLALKDDSQLRPLRDGIDFLGYVIRPTHTLVRRRVVAHAVTALAGWERVHVQRGRIRATPADLRALLSTVASYGGHVRQASSYRLRARIRERFPWLRTAAQKRRIALRDEGHVLSLHIEGARHG